VAVPEAAAAPPVALPPWDWDWPVLPMVLAAAAPPAPPFCVVFTGVARLAAAATVILPLVPLTVLFDEFEMFGLQPPAFTIGGVATPATHIAMVSNAIHLFIRIFLYGLVG
jgi:hypothetical protein